MKNNLFFFAPADNTYEKKKDEIKVTGIDKQEKEEESRVLEMLISF